MKVNLNEAAEFILNNDNYLITCHIEPDGDCLSSAISLGTALRRLGKKVKMTVDSVIPDIYKKIPMICEITERVDFTEDDFDNLIVVDSSSPDRMGKYEKFLGKKTSVVIDHHATNTEFGDYNWVDSSYAAAAQMVYELLVYFKIEFDPVLATLNLLGIQTDTGFFKYSNTDERLLRTAADLVGFGAKIYDNSSLILENNSIQEYKLMAMMIDNIEFRLDGELAFSRVTVDMIKKCGCSENDGHGLISNLRSISGVETAILLTESEDDLIKVSFRSKKWFDVAKVAFKFGGGGHVRASGCGIKGNIDEITDRIVNYTVEEMKNSKEYQEE